MKENFRKEDLTKTKLIMKSTLSGRNKIMTVNAWVVSLMGYGADIMKWTKNELDEIGRMTRKVMTVNKELRPRSDVDRLYVSWTGGGRGLIGCKMRVKVEENSFGFYFKHHMEPFVVAVRNRETIPGKKNQHSQKNLSNKIMRKK